MSFQQGLSGINMAAKALDIMGNNIANAQTVGFKVGGAKFGDIYAASMTSTRHQIGQGSNVLGVAQVFTQGNVTSSNNPLDIAIKGEGFLRFQPNLTDTTPLYSRNGQLHINADGYLVNSLDQFLNVYPSPDGLTIDNTDAKPLQLPAVPLPPKQTGTNELTEENTGGVFIGANLNFADRRAVYTDPANTNWQTLMPWNAANIDPSMYNYSTSLNIFDQVGEPHVLTMYFIRQGDSSTGPQQRDWQVKFMIDNRYEVQNFYDQNGNGQPMLQFDPTGRPNLTTFGLRFTLDLQSTVDVLGLTSGDLTDPNGLALFDANIPLKIDFAQMTQFASKYDVHTLQQDGYAPGSLSGLDIDPEGKITGRYSNGRARLLAQIPLTLFRNPNGLIPLGDNMFAPSIYAGEPLEAAAGSGARGAIVAGSVEDANVDLTKELVDMITLQRTYQANVQTIKTQDSIMQTVVNLR